MTDYTKLAEALRCCIQNPPETCVGCTYNIGNNECNVKMMIVDAAAAIEALQAQLPKRGEWIEENGIKVYCSVCNWASYSMITEKDAFILRYHKTNYCPNCGAKMEEVQE